MSDYTAEPYSLITCGMTGSGKTTFIFRYLLNCRSACNFIFDDMGQAAARLKIRPATTAHELEAALATRWVVFYPYRMFGKGQLIDAFRFFCDWALNASMRGPGDKNLLVDEAWRFQNGFTIPPELAAVPQMGRVERLHLITATQTPNKLNSSIIGGATEAVVFRLDESNALETVEDEFGIDPDIVRSLPMGTYISKNRQSGAILKGRIF